MSNRIMQSSVLAVAMMALASTAGAQSQTITFSVGAINQVAVTGSPVLNITTAVAGNDPTQASYGTATWAVTTNQSGAKITGTLDSDMPTGLTLKVSLTAPSGATSAGAKTLTSGGVDLVTSVTQVAASGLAMSYTLDAIPTAGVVSTGTRTVTYTITGGT